MKPFTKRFESAESAFACIRQLLDDVNREDESRMFINNEEAVDVDRLDESLRELDERQRAWLEDVKHLIESAFTSRPRGRRETETLH